MANPVPSPASADLFTQPDAELQAPQPVEFELVNPLIVDEGIAQFAELQPLYRAPFGGGDGGRFYFREGSPEFYAGYSLWTKSVLPTSPGLMAWKIANGDSGALTALAAREYGSFFHLTIAEHERRDNPVRFKFNESDWRERIRETVAHFGLPSMFVDEWTFKLQNDMAAYFAWKREHQVQIIAIETPVYCDRFKIATPLDMVVSCLVKESPYAKKPTRREVCAVDFKTGDSGCAYPEYALQLEFCRYAWNLRFKKTRYEVVGIYNWHPKKRSVSACGYHFVNQARQFTKPQFIHHAKACPLFKIHQPTGRVLLFTDHEDDAKSTFQVVTPYQWLERFFAKTPLL